MRANGLFPGMCTMQQTFGMNSKGEERTFQACDSMAATKRNEPAKVIPRGPLETRWKPKSENQVKKSS